jgi:hypothetical protein
VPTTQLECRDTGFVLINEDGEFVQFEVSVQALQGEIYLVLKELFYGVLVRTTVANARKTGLTYYPDGSHAILVAPLNSAYATLGNDYIKSFGAGVIELALKEDRVVPMHKAFVAEWEEPDFSAFNAQPGWQKGSVIFFNSSWIGGAGMARLEDGRTCLVHCLQIEDEGGLVSKQRKLPFLNTGDIVAVDVEPGGKPGQWKGKKIRKLASAS